MQDISPKGFYRLMISVYCFLLGRGSFVDLATTGFYWVVLVCLDLFWGVWT